MKYYCLRCGFNAKQKIDLERHLNRKNICDPIDDFISINEVKKHYGFDIKKKSSTQTAPLSTQTALLSTQIAPKQHPSNFLISTQTAPLGAVHSTQIAPLGAVHSTQTAPLGADHKHTCSFCGKSFTRNTGLTKHLKIFPFPLGS